MDDTLANVAHDGYAFKQGDWVGPIDPAEEECATCDERRKGCSFCCGRTPEAVHVRDLGVATCRRCKVQAAFCPCDNPDLGPIPTVWAWLFYWWHNFRVTRWLCPTCRKLDRLEHES